MLKLKPEMVFGSKLGISLGHKGIIGLAVDCRVVHKP